MKPKTVYYIVRHVEKSVWRRVEPYHYTTEGEAKKLAIKLRKDKENVFVTTVKVVKITEEVIA